VDPLPDSADDMSLDQVTEAVRLQLSRELGVKP